VHDADCGAVAEAAAEVTREPRVAFHRQYAGARAGQWAGDRAWARAEVDDQVAVAEVGRADQLSDDSAVGQQVHAGRGRGETPRVRTHE
jgi:hypothetical protein